jgi:glycosyltransferase involved in cell wall biosynthesis|tara:strand:- start:11164 stop:12258 length:1095 start_codon:yes stop_codon:yes gene_type:complete
MKVAMVFPDPLSEKGISKYSSDLIKNIKKQDVDFDEITFMAGKPLTLFRNFFILLKHDIIHIQHEYNMLGLYGLPYFVVFSFLGIFKKKSLIVTMHTVPSQKTTFKGGSIKNFLRKLLYKIQNKWINLTSNKIIVHANFFKEILINEYSISKEKIKVLPHAIIEDLKITDKIKTKKEFNLSGPVYLLIGTMIPDHGHDIILNQADKIGKTILVATNPNSVNDRNVERIKNFLKFNQNIVKQNNFEKFVRFDLGFISYEDWWKYFSAADLILLPYKEEIGSGIFADAMAMKKPVIASNVRYFKEIEKNYNCIKTAEEDQDFSRIIKESMKPKNYNKMIEGCENFFKENSLTPISKKYKELYESLK